MTHTKHRKRRARVASNTRQQHHTHVHLDVNGNVVTAEELHAMGWREGGFAREHKMPVFMAPLGTAMPRQFP